MYTERPPADELADRIACLWHQVSEADGTHLVVPDGCVDLIWGPDGPHVAGPDTGPMPTPMRAGDTYTGIRFKPGAVGEVFGVPLHELRDQRIPLDHLTPQIHDTALLAADSFGRDHLPAQADSLLAPNAAAGVGWGDVRRAGALPHELAVAAAGLPKLEGLDATGAARLLAMRGAVVARLRSTPPPDPAARAMANALRSGRSVAEVAWELGFSERQLHRRALASFGYAPKTLQRIVRFQRALRLARSGVPLAEVAISSGYTDQAHLSHDVKRLSGVSMSHLT